MVDRRTLDLLAAMVEADSLATGPSAWGSWKAGLVADLVERTRRVLAGEPAAPARPRLTEDVRIIMDTVRSQSVPALAIEQPTVTVVAPDRPGLLAEVTAVLALHGLNVRSADITGEDGVAVEIFTVEPERGRWPAAARLSDDLAAVTNGRLPVEERLADRARTYRGHRDGRLSIWFPPRSPWTTPPPTWPRWSRSGPRTSSASCTGSPRPSSTVAST